MSTRGLSSFETKKISDMNYCEFMAYLKASNHLGGKKITRVITELTKIDADKKLVLDAGCGNGKTTLHIAKKYGNCQIVGIDKYDGYLKLARSKSIDVKDRVDYIVSDICLLPFTDENFDLIISEDVFPFIEDREKALKELSRVLKQNGRIAISMSFCLTQPDETFLKVLRKMYKLNVDPIVLPEFRKIIKKLELKETKFVKPKLNLINTLDFFLILKIFFLSTFNRDIRRRFLDHLYLWRKVLRNTDETIGFGIFILKK